ncbi:MAG: excinuclease ABC subunit UvrA [Patescibacteria group bacterium]|nr:excinuclease ABC subunit UvrA [Patescibacteria group bacterium]
MKEIKVRGARKHNLKNIDVDIPKNQLVVFTGVSGSGKSSLALDTIYAEGQRRYVESLSSYARQFLGVQANPEVESIQGLSPSIAISQKKPFHNPRSTVGTITEIYDFLRLLYSRIGHPHCPQCGKEVMRQSVDEIVDAVYQELVQNETNNSKKGMRVLVLAPLVKDRKGEYSSLFENLKKQGFSRARVDGEVRNLDEDFVLIKTNRHSIEAVVDRLVLENLSRSSGKDRASSQASRLTDAISQALNLAGGEVIVFKVLDKTFDFPEKPKEMEDHLFSELFACPNCNINLQELEPRSFSFNSPHGACPECEGLGTKLKVDKKQILNPRLSIDEGGILPLSQLTIKNTWYQKHLASVGREHGFNLDQPLGTLTSKQKEVLIEGTGNQEYLVRGRNRKGEKTSFTETFPGLIKKIEERHEETNSSRIRNHLEKYMFQETCPRCNGTRLKKESRSVTIGGKNIAELTADSIKNSLNWIENLSKNISEREKTISKPITREILSRLKFLNSVGLSYLTLDRAASTLSGGEAQRIRLASQIGSGLSGVVYVLDEPSVGLHNRDMKKLVSTLKGLRDLDNTVVVVEHDPLTIRKADYVIDFGPGGGKWGGKVVAKGSPKDIESSKNSITGDYLTGKKKVTAPKLQMSNSKLQKQKDNPKDKKLTVVGAREHNLKNIDVEIPLGKFVCVTGVSGSGKSTLVQETLHRSLRRELNLKIEQPPGEHDGLLGTELIDKVYEIDQSPIGQSPRSNPATYTKAFDYIRKAFARTKEARLRGFDKGYFSFNTKGGRCETCEGQGEEKIEMQFLPDVYVTCEVCNGARYSREVLEIKYRGKTIKDILEMTVGEALIFFDRIDPLVRRLKTLSDVGLDYIQLGQPAPTLSGGEAQRVKIAKELSKKPRGHTFYILDEPTIGLHPDDLNKLLVVLHRLVARGNTVLVIEHNLDLIKNSDWIIDLGPEGGEGGGEVIFAGTSEKILDHKTSYTARALRNYK